MNLKLPFYGKKGTISHIEEQDRYYQVYRYNVDGREDIVLDVAKTNNNYNDLLDNYYSDLKEYLDFNNNKYESYKQTKLKKDINMKLANGLKIASIIMIGASIPLLSTHEALGYLGVTLDILSLPILVSSINLSISDANNNKKKKFINKYNELEHSLRIYNEGKTKNKSLTKYTGLKADDKEPRRELELKKY